MYKELVFFNESLKEGLPERRYFLRLKWPLQNNAVFKATKSSWRAFYLEFKKKKRKKERIQNQVTKTVPQGTGGPHCWGSRRTRPKRNSTRGGYFYKNKTFQQSRSFSILCNEIGRKKIFCSTETKGDLETEPLTWEQTKHSCSRSSRRGAMEMNLTMNYEVEGSIPGLAQRAKDPVLPWAVA